MTDIAVNFRTFVLADATINEKVGGRMHYLKMPQAKQANPVTPYIWYRMRQALSLDTLNPDVSTVPYDVSFDMECVAMNNEQLAREVAALVNTRCNFYRGALGDTTAKGVFVNDQDDDYENQSTGGDDRMAVAALDVRVVT